MNPTSNSNQQVPVSPLLTTKEAAAYLKISRDKVFKLIRRGDLVPIRFDRVLRFAIKDLDDFISQVRKEQIAHRARRGRGLR